MQCDESVMRLEFTVRGAERCLLGDLVSFPGVFSARLSCVLMENWQNSLSNWHEKPAWAGHDAEVQRWQLVVDLLFAFITNQKKHCIRRETAAIRSNWTLSAFLHSCGNLLQQYTMILI